MERSKIFTHRGLEPSKINFFGESTYEAFQDHIQRGFGIEFDPNFLKEGNIVIAHDKGLTRITGGKDKRLFIDLTLPEVQAIKFPNGHIPSFEELADLILKSRSPLHAVHFKGGFQEQSHTASLLEHIEKYPGLAGKLLMFDVKPEVAKQIRSKIPQIKLAPSVAHPYDIERYNNAVLGTLISVEDAIKYKQEGLYDWVWLDEWDLTDRDGGVKKLYTQETLNVLHGAGYKIALVTPELHGTSPGLLGGEAHPDAKPQERLFSRIREIIALQPDAICTDYPEECANL